MGAILPKGLASMPIVELVAKYLPKIHEGKVRVTFEIPGTSLLLVVVTDRLSIFDFVLPCHVPGKGIVLNKISIHWMTKVLKNFPNHLMAHGSDVDIYLPDELKNNRELWDRATVVEKLEMEPWECIVRGYLTGSGLRDYRKTGKICGHQIVPGLHDGSKLPFFIFTPTTKAETGHDEPIDYRSVDPRLAAGSLLLYETAVTELAEKGIIIADTKMEFGRGKHDLCVLADEILTPDSSRFWLESDWVKYQAQKKSPPGIDKESARRWGKSIKTPFKTENGEMIFGLHNLDPENQEHLAFVHDLTVPQEVIDELAGNYQYLLGLITAE